MSDGALNDLHLTDFIVNSKREHIPPEARVYCVITIVHPQAKVWYYMCPPNRELDQGNYTQSLDILRGTLPMTRTTCVTVSNKKLYRSSYNNPICCTHFMDNRGI